MAVVCRRGKDEEMSGDLTDLSATEDAFAGLMELGLELVLKRLGMFEGGSPLLGQGQPIGRLQGHVRSPDIELDDEVGFERFAETTRDETEKPPRSRPQRDPIQIPIQLVDELDSCQLNQF
jgi:hypothetical protein